MLRGSALLLAAVTTSMIGLNGAMVGACNTIRSFSLAVPASRGPRRPGRRTPVAVDRRRAAKRRNQARNRRAQR